MDRKAFIKLVARGGLLSSLALAAGILVARNQVVLEKECGLEGHCENCRILEQCSLPNADKTRRKA